MKNKQSYFELIGFYLGAIIGSIVYVSLILEITLSLMDTNLADVIEMTIGCVVGVWLFLFLSAKIGQNMSLLIWKYAYQINVNKAKLSSLLTNTTESNITTYSNGINFPKQRTLKLISSKKML